MVDFQGQLIPESERENALLTDIYGVTGEAKKEGVSTRAIVSSLLFAALSIYLFGDEDAEMVGERREGSEDETEICPSCGEEIDEVLASMGGSAKVLPCGCEVHIDDVDGWFDDE